MARKMTGWRKAATKGELVLVGGVAPKKRNPGKRDWSKAKEQAFFETLAETCNVTAAAAAAGMSISWAYRRRRRNAAFRASWVEAIGVGYQRLEIAMLDRALNGSEKIITRKDGSEERVREYPNQIAMSLLKLHRETAAEAESEPDPEDADEIRERLVRKLERLRLRFEQEREEQEARETQ